MFKVGIANKKTSELLKEIKKCHEILQITHRVQCAGQP